MVTHLNCVTPAYNFSRAFVANCEWLFVRNSLMLGSSQMVSRDLVGGDQPYGG